MQAWSSENSGGVIESAIVYLSFYSRIHFSLIHLRVLRHEIFGAGAPGFQLTSDHRELTEMPLSPQPNVKTPWGKNPSIGHKTKVENRIRFEKKDIRFGCLSWSSCTIEYHFIRTKEGFFFCADWMVFFSNYSHFQITLQNRIK